jgi:hypothetical protein
LSGWLVGWLALLVDRLVLLFDLLVDWVGWLTLLFDWLIWLVLLVDFIV